MTDEQNNDFYEILPIIKSNLTLDAKVARIKTIFEKLHKKPPTEIEELELRAYKRGYEAMIVDAKEVIEKHLKSNTYEAEESLVFKTTIKEVLQILDTLKA